MFGLKTLKKEIESLRVQQKSFNGQRIFWEKNDTTTIRLFDFEDFNHVKMAISSVPELASQLNYIGKSFTSGIFKHLKNDTEIESPVIKLLNNPNELMSGEEFKQIFAEWIFSYGFVPIYCDTSGLRENTNKITLLEPYNLKVKVGDITINDYLKKGNPVIKKIEYNFQGKKFELEIENVIIITYNSNYSIQDGYVVYESPLKPLENALEVTPAIYSSMSKLNNNLGMTGFISNKSTDSGTYVPILDSEKEKIQTALKNYGTKKGQSHLAFANYDLKYIPISSPINQMLLPEQQKMIKTIIADILGFDILILNNTEGNKYANYEQARTSLFTENIINVANKLTNALTNYFFKFYPNNKIILDYSHLDIFSKDEKTKAETANIEIAYIINLNTAVTSGQMTRENAIQLLISNDYDEETANSLIQ